MKKTLAIVLALVMVLSVMAMIPASAAETKVLGWTLFNQDATVVGSLVEKDGKALLTSNGQFGVDASFAISTEKVKVDGFTLELTNVNGFTGSGDEWVAIGFLDKQEIFKTESCTANGFIGLMNFNGFHSHKANPFGAYDSCSMSTRFPSLNGIAMTSSAFSITYTFKLEDSKWHIYHNAGFSEKLPNGEDKTTENFNAAIDSDGKAYVFVGLQSAAKPTMSVSLNALAAAPAPATGDATMIYAVVAIIACAVVVGSTVVLKKKED